MVLEVSGLTLTYLIETMLSSARPLRGKDRDRLLLKLSLSYFKVGVGPLHFILGLRLRCVLAR